ncbi:MAG: ATP-dependent DNA helicase RecG, partial [Solirubrobacteraceae bacterium]
GSSWATYMPRVALVNEQSQPSTSTDEVDLPVRAFAGLGELDRAQMLCAPLRWPVPSRLSAELKVPRGKATEAMKALGLRTIGDLLEHLPRESRPSCMVGSLRPGEPATIDVQVRTIATRAVRRRGMRPLVEATVSDASGSIRITIFNQPWLAIRYRPGTRLLLHGKADGRGGFAVSHHVVPNDGQSTEADAVAHYAATEGINSTQILKFVHGARGALADICEALPAYVRASQQLPDLPSALAALHFPRDASDPEAGRRRLAFDELLLTQLAFLRRRARHRSRGDAPAFERLPTRSAGWLAEELPFELTEDQQTAIEEISADLAQPNPMQRLLMGDVGAGKTVVALYAMLRAVEHDHQAALMAPTETLAEQHFATLQKLITAEPVTIALLTGSTPARRRADILGKLASGELSLIVGTHALIEPTVQFRSLALAIVDEQHRFGVLQRAALDDKGSPSPPGEGTTKRSVHVLHMTATPIPRTLALASYGDLDVSTLRQMPKGRQPIETRIVSTEQARKEAYAQLRSELDSGRQGYVVCPLIEQAVSDDPFAVAGEREVRAAVAEFKRLGEGELANYRLVLMHGQMPTREKQEAMARFADGEVDVLVSTTVIEVGIDVPNATVMMIENAERFGISQLHQLRGRIGRGRHHSYCMLMGPAGSSRLRAVARYSDGFRLAEIDLALRKQGDLIGTRQSGVGQYRVARIPGDEHLLDRARAQAERIMQSDSLLSSPEHVLLGELLDKRSAPGEPASIPA